MWKERSSRMMVTKIWNSCFPEKSTLQKVHRHHFYLCQWQRNTQVRIIYLLYRWLAAIVFLAVIIFSILDIGRTEPMFEHHYAKWWIYLTHWGILACTIQAWLAAWIVTQGMMVEREDFEIMRRTKTSRLHRMYSVFYNFATVYSFIITACYWTVVYDPGVSRLDAVNLMVHILNSVMMLIDLAIVSHPIKLNHAYWTTGIGLMYGIFTGVYYVAGGTNRREEKAIYSLLDWSRPGHSIVVTAAAILFVFIVHCLVYCLYKLRVCIYTKVCLRNRGSREKMSAISRTLSNLEQGQKENFLNPTNIVDLKL